MTENKMHKYWFIEDEDGNVDGFESLSACSEKHVKEYMKTNYNCRVKAYPTTKAELYLSEVDIY